MAGVSHVTSKRPGACWLFFSRRCRPGAERVCSVPQQCAASRSRPLDARSRRLERTSQASEVRCREGFRQWSVMNLLLMTMASLTLLDIASKPGGLGNSTAVIRDRLEPAETREACFWQRTAEAAAPQAHRLRVRITK